MLAPDRAAVRRDALILASLALVATAAYAATAKYGFVYDDVHIIQRNALLHSLANWKAILSTGWWGHVLYRPFTLLTFALDWAMGDGAPQVFHVGNIVWHAAVTLAVYLLARGSLDRTGAAAAALLFAVHPVHVEAVANVVGRAELLAGLFTVLAALVYRRDGELAARGDRSGKRIATSLLTLAALGLALASKEIAFAAPGILLLVDWLDGRTAGTQPAERFRAHATLWFATVALTAAWLWMWLERVGQLGVGAEAPGLVGEGLVGRALAMAPVMVEYARLLLVPVRLSADYSPDYLTVVPSLTRGAVGGVAVVAAVIALAWVARHRMPTVTFGLLWTCGTLLLVSNILVPGEVLLAERSLYLPSIGVALALGSVTSWAARRWRAPTIGTLALIVLLGLVRTVVRAPTWRDNDTFFHQLVRDAPESYRGAWVAAMLAYEAGDRSSGRHLLMRAVEIYPLDPGLWVDLATQAEKDRQWSEAGRYFGAAYQLDSTRTDLAAFAVVNLVRAGALDSADALARAAWHRDPGEFRLKIARSDVALARGRPLEAMTWRRRVALEFPTVWQYWYLTADAALRARYCWEATRSIGRVRVLRPDAPEFAGLEDRVRELGCRA